MSVLEKISILFKTIKKCIGLSQNQFIFNYFTFPKRCWGEFTNFIPTEGKMFRCVRLEAAPCRLIGV